MQYLILTIRGQKWDTSEKLILYVNVAVVQKEDNFDRRFLKTYFYLFFWEEVKIASNM